MAIAVPMPDFYAVLETDPSASIKDIKTAYRRLARQFHPDKNNGSQASTVQTQRINAAWEILGDVSKRREYDICRLKATVQAEPERTRSTSPAPRPQRPTPPQYSRSYAGPRTTSFDDDRVRGHLKRQAWLKFERQQENAMRDLRAQMQALKSEIAILNADITTHEFSIAVTGHGPYVDELRRRVAEAQAKVYMWQSQLEYDEAGLQRMEHELVQRRAQEYARVAKNRKEERQKTEQEEKERLEKVQRARAEAEARRKRDQEWEARMEDMRQRMKQFGAKKPEPQADARARDAKVKDDTTPPFADRPLPPRFCATETRARTYDYVPRTPVDPPKTQHVCAWREDAAKALCGRCASSVYRCVECRVETCLFCAAMRSVGREPGRYKTEDVKVEKVKAPEVKVPEIRVHGVKVEKSHVEEITSKGATQEVNSEGVKWEAESGARVRHEMGEEEVFYECVDEFDDGDDDDEFYDCEDGFDG